MKLYLSSHRIADPDVLFKMIGKQPEEIKVALIPNAKDNHSGEVWRSKVEDMMLYLGNLALNARVVNLRDYNEKTETLEALKDYDLIWAQGGNTFCLRYEMQRSGFDQIIGKLLDNGIVYGGDSAGAVVAGVTLKGIEFGDDPLAAKEVIEDGLGFVDRFILPHADSADFAEAAKAIKHIYSADDSLIVLNDNQAYIVDGDKQKIITKS